MPETDDRDASLREHVLYVLRGGGAHVQFDEVMKDFPVELINRKVEGVPYTPPQRFPVATQNAARVFWWLAESDAARAATARQRLPNGG